MRTINFHPDAFAEFNEWGQTDRKVQQKIVTLIKDALRTPFTGLGKPELLKYGRYKGCWSRRITEEDRLVYKVTDTALVIAQCKFHYDD